MSEKFDNLRQAIRAYLEQLGPSPNEGLLEFRNAATITVIHSLLREYDRLQEHAAAPVANHSAGTLTAAEAALLAVFRAADEDSKVVIQIAAEASVKVAAKFATKDRCAVIDIGSARPSSLT